jgi:hypothetical protein
VEPEPPPLKEQPLSPLTEPLKSPPPMDNRLQAAFPHHQPVSSQVRPLKQVKGQQQQHTRDVVVEQVEVDTPSKLEDHKEVKDKDNESKILFDAFCELIQISYQLLKYNIYIIFIHIQ